MSETVKVMVRCRPFNSKEKEMKCKQCVEVDEQTNQIHIIKPDDKENLKTFTFDNVYGIQSR